tara:strand:- start:2015 stop:2308 length:294 start_codon:yes stop_codon:yes gene_type:complete
MWLEIDYDKGPYNGQENFEKSIRSFERAGFEYFGRQLPVVSIPSGEKITRTDIEGILETPQFGNKRQIDALQAWTLFDLIELCQGIWDIKQPISPSL